MRIEFYAVNLMEYPTEKQPLSLLLPATIQNRFRVFQIKPNPAHLPARHPFQRFFLLHRIQLHILKTIIQFLIRLETTNFRNALAKMDRHGSASLSNKVTTNGTFGDLLTSLAEMIKIISQCDDYSVNNLYLLT